MLCFFTSLETNRIRQYPKTHVLGQNEPDSKRTFYVCCVRRGNKKFSTSVMRKPRFDSIETLVLFLRFFIQNKFNYINDTEGS